MYSDRGDVTKHQDAYSCSHDLVSGGQTQLFTWKSKGYPENQAQFRPLGETAIRKGSVSGSRPGRYTTTTVIYHYLP